MSQSVTVLKLPVTQLASFPGLHAQLLSLAGRGGLGTRLAQAAADLVTTLLGTHI